MNILYTLSLLCLFLFLFSLSFRHSFFLEALFPLIQILLNPIGINGLFVSLTLLHVCVMFQSIISLSLSSQFSVHIYFFQVFPTFFYYRRSSIVGVCYLVSFKYTLLSEVCVSSSVCFSEFSRGWWWRQAVVLCMDFQKKRNVRLEMMMSIKKTDQVLCQFQSCLLLLVVQERSKFRNGPIDKDVILLFWW